MVNPNTIFSIVEHYEGCLKEYGATEQGVGWPRQNDIMPRFKALTKPIDLAQKVSILDLGCGYGALIEYFKEQNCWGEIDYTGIDASAKMIEQAQLLHPGVVFECRHILDMPLPATSFDYVLMNGLFTYKGNNSFSDMQAFAFDTISAAFKICRRAIVFNCMNKHVDWERDDLFHMPFDVLADFLTTYCSRNYAFSAHYGLYEYMTYVYKDPIT